MQVTNVRTPSGQGTRGMSWVMGMDTDTLLLCVCVASVVSNSLQPCGPQPARLLCPWDPPGKETGAGCCFLLQGVFPTQGLNLGLDSVPPGKP